MTEIINRVYCADAVDKIYELAYDVSPFVDLTVTSPPYDNIRKYNGFTFNHESMLKAIYDVTVEGGVCVWVVNDTTTNGDESLTSFRQALFAQQIGWKVHDTMIWVKDGGGAVGSNKAYWQNFEYMFVFVKGKIKTYNLIEDKPNQSYGRGASTKRIGRRLPDGTHRVEDRPAPKQFSRRNNWWYIPVTHKSEHPATFPPELARDHILTWSNEGDVVLDPMCGSGTTLVEAKNLNRKYIGIDISKEYVEMSKVRLT